MICSLKIKKLNFFSRIGLVQVFNPITLNVNVQIIPMASAAFAPGVNGVSSGWGQGSRFELHFFYLTSLTNADCRIRLPEGFGHVIYDNILCMLPALGNAVCDRGNPLVADGHLVGVSSWDAACDGTMPSMHERVYHFRSWIQSVIA